MFGDEDGIQTAGKTAAVRGGAMLGKLPEFDPDGDNCDVFFERFECFAAANDIAEDKKLQVLLTSIGEKAYVTLRSLLLPKTPTQETYDVVIATLKKHYTPKCSVVTERYRFNQRNQEPHESISDFIVGLKKLAATCEFGTFLEQALRDRLIAGLCSDSIRCRLLATPDAELTWERTCSIVAAMESATRGTREMVATLATGTPVDSDVHWNKETAAGQRQAPAGDYARSFMPKTTSAAGTQETKGCHRCGGRHSPVSCPFMNSRCFKCNKKGHVAKMCKTRAPIHCLANDATRDELLTLCHTDRRSGTPAIVVPLLINGKKISMELDTGAAVSVMCETERLKHFPDASFRETDVRLVTYNGTPVTVKGIMDVDVEYQSQHVRLPLVIAKDSTGARMPTLLGREWLTKIKLDWLNVVRVQNVREEAQITDKYREVFQPGYGAIKGFHASIVLKKGATPVFCKARPVPYALREQVEQELLNMEKAGIVYRVRHSAWATPLVVVPKKNNGIRLCGDYRVTVNPFVVVDHYPLPLPEDIFTTLQGGAVFSVLDLSKAYLQLELDEHAQELLTINTHMGLFRYRRLPYGVACAPAAFQAVMDQVLRGLQGTACYLDDVIIAGVSYEQCRERVEQVLMRLSEYGIKVNAEKCSLFKKRVTYLGHEVDGNGLHPTSDKVRAIKNAPKPDNVTQLKAFLGLVNFYAKFLPNVATVLEPLHGLLRKETKWHWSRLCDDAFNKCKTLLTDESVLEIYDVAKEIQLTCDASEYGLGAVLSHVVNGQEKPIAFASRSLSVSERNYGQIEKEALSIVFGVRKFHKYLYGRAFNVLTDHQPLTALFDPHRHCGAVAIARVHRWLTFLADYRYKITHKPGSAISHADALSRLPLSEGGHDEDTICYFSTLSDLPLTAKDIERATGCDSLLRVVRNRIWQGWPKTVSAELQPFWVRRFELTVDEGCIVWNNRVVVPESLKTVVLALLHEQHLGISKMKAVARSMVWWPGIDDALEQAVRKCSICQAVLPAAQPVPLFPWKVCEHPWQRVHLDFAEKESQIFLIAVDAFSKWIEVKCMQSTTAAKTVEAVRSWFASHGLPVEVVTDNGPQFRAAEFLTFLKANGVKHTLTPPYHPQSNGAAERAVQTTKKALLKQLMDDERTGTNRSLQHRLDNFLFSYRATPHTFTGKSPAELFLRRKLRTRLSLLRPDVNGVLTDQAEEVKTSADKRRAVFRSFAMNECVLVRSVRGETVKWLPGRVLQVKSICTYLVLVGNRVRYVHADHLRHSCLEREKEPAVDDEFELPHVPEERDPTTSTTTLPPITQHQSSTERMPQPDMTTLRRSTRQRRAPDRWGYSSRT